MGQDTYDAVDLFIGQTLFAAEDEVLEAALADAAAAGLPEIQVTPPQGRLLEILCRSIGASQILEFGTLGGYSTIVMARTLPADGNLTTLEYDPDHAEVAWDNIERAGLGHLVDIRLGKAIDSLPKIAAEGGAPFDLVFIDADKPGNADYFAWAMKLTRVGSLVIVDNVVRNGAVIDANGDANVQGARRLHEAMAKEPRVSATAVQTVGSKGYDGFAIAVVTG